MSSTTADRLGAILAERLPGAHPEIRARLQVVLEELPEVVTAGILRGEMTLAAEALESAAAALRAHSAPGPAASASESAGRLRDWLA